LWVLDVKLKYPLPLAGDSEARPRGDVHMSSRYEELLEELLKPSPLELHSTGLSRATWLIFIGVVLFIGALIDSITRPSSDLSPLFVGWLLAGIFGLAGYVKIMSTLKFERLKLAAHMFRSMNLYAYIAMKQGNREALLLLSDVGREEYGFVIGAFRDAGINTEQYFVQDAIKNMEKLSEPPYILVYRSGILDVPATLMTHYTLRGVTSLLALLALILFGLLMLMTTIIGAPIFIYLTGRTLRNHAIRENKVRRALGLPETPEEAPDIRGLLLSILSAGLYLPIYARKLARSVDEHIRAQLTKDIMLMESIKQSVVGSESSES